MSELECQEKLQFDFFFVVQLSYDFRILPRCLNIFNISWLLGIFVDLYYIVSIKQSYTINPDK